MEDKIKELGLLLGKANKLFEEIQNTPTSDPAEFEKGKWYYGCCDAPHQTFLAKFDKVFNDRFYYSERFWNWMPDDQKYEVKNDWSSLKFVKRQATEEEIKQALMAEASRRGFSDLTNFIAVRDTKSEDWGSSREGSNMSYTTDRNKGRMCSIKSTQYNPHTDTLTCYGSGVFVMYEKGVWAEINSKQLTFGGNPVTIDGNKITCKGVTGTYEQLKRIYDFTLISRLFEFGDKIVEEAEWSTGAITGYADSHIVKVKVGCSWGTIEEIRAILDECEKNNIPKD